MVTDPVMRLYHIPGCPFSERVEILMRLKGLESEIVDQVIDITIPRPDWLLVKTGGTTSLPVLDVPEGTLKESMVILRYLEDRFTDVPVAQRDPWRHAVESSLILQAGSISAAGYKMVMNQDRDQREDLKLAVDQEFAKIDAMLSGQNPNGVFLFDSFGWFETAITPTIKRLWFLEYYEDYAIPASLKRLHRWRDGCLAHPATQDRGMEEIVKYYHDYSRGVGGGRLPEGRSVSSFTLNPRWSDRPMPPRNKWEQNPTDEQLGLLVVAH